MVSLLTLKFTVALLSLSLCVAQPILNNNKNDASQQEEEEVVTEISRSKASSSALIQLVVDNDEARKKWFYQREQSLHFALNGANGHYLKTKDDDESGDASAIPAQDSVPVATPDQLRAILKKKTGTVSTDLENKRVVRQAQHQGFQVAPTFSGYQYPNAYQQQPYVYTSPSPLSTSAPEVITEAAPIPATEAAATSPSVAPDIQKARDEYRKSRFEGSAYALALKLSKAGNQALSGSGSYSG